MDKAWIEENQWAIRDAEHRDRRIVGEPPRWEQSINGLGVWVRKVLHPVAASGCSASGLVQWSTPSADGACVLLCGERDGKAFERSDGLRCNFKINLRKSDKHLELLSYAMHVDAPGDDVHPRFLRWEFQPARKPGVHAIREPLAHLHPGHDRVRVPSPVLSPRELVAVFLGLERWS